MGRLVGIAHFFTEAPFSEEKNDVAAVHRAKKLDDDGDALLAEQLQIVKRLQGHLIGHFLRRTTSVSTTSRRSSCHSFHMSRYWAFWH